MADWYIVASGKTIPQLIDAVNDLVAHGWRAVGGIAVVSDRGYAHQSFRYLQAMTRTVDDEDE